MSGGAALSGAHTPLPKDFSSFRSTIFRFHPFVSYPRNGNFFKPQISTLAVSYRSFYQEPWEKKKKNKNSTKIESTCAFGLSSDFEGESSDGDFIVVNFYRFVHIKDPEEEVAKHLSFLQVHVPLGSYAFCFSWSFSFTGVLLNYYVMRGFV